ncbi:unnamed protein product [Prunus armeniaca]
MTTTDAFVDFPEDIVAFLWGQAPKVSGGAIANTPRLSRISIWILRPRPCSMAKASLARASAWLFSERDTWLMT